MDKISGKFFDAPKGAQYARTRFCIPQPNGITECEVMFYRKEVNKEDNTTQWRRYETDSDNEYPQWVRCSEPKKKSLVKLV